MRQKVLYGFIVFAMVLGIVFMPHTPAAQASTWSTGMFTIDRGCSWFSHCRWVATELNFYPSCYYITWKGQNFGDLIRNKYGETLTLTLDIPGSKSGHRTYGWGVPRRFIWDNSDWKNNSNWRFHKTC